VDVATEIVIKLSSHGKRRLRERVAPHLTDIEPKDWIRKEISSAVERCGYTRKPPKWVHRRWHPVRDSKRGSDVYFIRSKVGVHRFCLIVGRRVKENHVVWTLITILPESFVHERPGYR
jgi:hypothetical protein